MRALLSGLRRWWQRRFRGYVAAPAGSGGTAWQQWPSWRSTFFCQCGLAGEFTPDTYKILSQDHAEGCDGWTGFQPGSSPCNCPVTEARYVKICPTCRTGHWKQAKP